MTAPTMEDRDLTADDRAAWHALADAAQAAHKAHEGAAGMVGYYMAEHLAEGAFTPAAYGLPSEAALVAYRRAAEHAAKSAEHLAEWERLRAEMDAHPFGQWIAECRTITDAANAAAD